MILEINEKCKDQKFDLEQVIFYPKFFSIKESIDFNRLTAIMDVCEDKVIGSTNPTLIKILKVGNLPFFFKIQETIKSLLLHNYEMNTAIFASLNKQGVSNTHTDIETVFLIPTYGLVNYIIYENDNFIKNFQVEPGDLLIIPKNIAHSAIPLSPRIVISVGVYN